MNSPVTPLRLGLVGCGLVAQRYPKWLADDPRIEWTFFCDPRAEAAESFRAQYAPAAAAETDFSQALERHPVDAVILCSPNALHYEQTCRALEQGRHVLCEKPLAVDRAQIEDVVRRAASGRALVSVAHQRRYQSAFVTARRELTTRADVYGPVREIHVFMCEGWSAGIPGTWRDDPTQNRGYFGDAGIHLVDVVHFITGLQAERLYAVSDRRGRRVEVVTRILAEFTGGVGWSAHYVGDAHHMRDEVHFHCRDADLLIRGDELLCCRNGRCEPIADRAADDNPASALVEAILAGRPTASPPEIALPIFAWNEAVMESLRRGAWVDVNA